MPTYSTGLSDAQIAGKTLFMGLSVLLKRWTFDSVDWVWRFTLQCGQTSSGRLKGWIEQKNGGRMSWLSLCLSWDLHLFLPSDIDIPGSLAFGHVLNYISWFYSLQRADFSTSRPHNFMSQLLWWINLPLFLQIYISYWFCFSRESWMYTTLCIFLWLYCAVQKICVGN